MENKPKDYAILINDHPYDALNDEVFASLVLDIYRNNGHNVQSVDKLTREKGRDGILRNDEDKIIGNIQYKNSKESTKHEKNEEIKSEIIKFLIHSLQNPDFIPNKDDFTYYYVISHKFNDIEFI